MPNDYPLTDRREFFRYKLEQPIRFNVVEQPQGRAITAALAGAVTKNLSASGILFASTFLPQLSSILALDLDFRTTQICKEIEENALIVNNKIVGKVVRIEDNEDGCYNVGVAFIKKSDSLPGEILSLVK